MFVVEISVSILCITCAVWVGLEVYKNLKNARKKSKTPVRKKK